MRDSRDQVHQLNQRPAGRFPVKTTRLLAAIIIASFLAGCAHDKILFITNTQGGLQVGVNSQQIPQIEIGYNRQELALVPLYVEKYSGKVSGNSPYIAGLLGQAASAASKAESAANWTPDGVACLTTASGFVTDAIKENGGTDDMLDSITKTINALKSAPAKPSATDFDLLAGLIEVEIAKPHLVANFEHDAKYIGTVQSGNREDAYSVLGIFDGSAKGSAGGSNGSSAEGTIAQYFATGVAAQLLAQYGGAAAVSTAPNAQPKVADSWSDPNIRTHLTTNTLAKASGLIWNAGANASPRKAEAKLVLNKVETVNLDAVATTIGSLASEVDVRTYLDRYNEEEQINQISENIQKL